MKSIQTKSISFDKTVSNVEYLCMEYNESAVNCLKPEQLIELVNQFGCTVQLKMDFNLDVRCCYVKKIC